jgi:predicted N-acetyltransferase YhbS
MGIDFRPYGHASDFERVSRFLVETYAESGERINWLQPRWEYMHFHPYIREIDLGIIGLWEEHGRLLGLIHPEHAMNRFYIELRPGHEELKSAMIIHAETAMGRRARDAGRLGFYVDDRDHGLQDLLRERGYSPGDEGETMSRYVIPDSMQPRILPEGYRLASLADDNDLRKLHRVLWRGFGHGSEVPEDDLEERRFMQSAPNYRRELNLVAIAPDGSFASYCGMWFEPVHRIAYVEPVATDPDHRRLGLGAAVVNEGIRCCAALGARVAYVGSELPIYLSLGFRPIYRCRLWQASDS